MRLCGMKVSVLFALTATLGLASLPAVQAWGAAGHEIVATIAQIYLHPSVLTQVCSILYPDSSGISSPPCHISRIAAWADQVRRNPQYRYSGPLHYVGSPDDHPSETCAFPGERGWAGRKNVNVLGAVRNVTGILNDYLEGAHDRDTAEEAMKFLVHFVGDMHMPLHLTGRERGGNGVKVAFDGRVTNLHSLWDGLLIAQALRTIPRNYTHPFPAGQSSVDIETHLRGTIYDPYVRRIMYEGFGTGSIDGKFTDEYLKWLSCPQIESRSAFEIVQTFLGIRMQGDETGWDDEVLCPYAWAKDLHQLNCELPVWPRELDQPPYNQHAQQGSAIFTHFHEHIDAEHELSDAFSSTDTSQDASYRPPRPHPDLLELDTPEYAGRIRSEWVVERLLAMAGVRLAGILNGLFLSPDELVHTSAKLPVISMW